jgi:hypothetical protein
MNPPFSPRVTIGLVVRNGAAHLHEALNSLLHQRFHDFIVCVYDNASTDDTREIVLRYMARDSRIQYCPHESDIGPLHNFITAAEKADTEFFCWATHDDLHHPDFLSALVELLDQFPSAALACCAVRNMNPDGTLLDIRSDTASLRTTVNMRAVERVRMQLTDGPGTPFYGLFRTMVLKHELEFLRMIAERSSIPMLGLDIAFITHTICNHDIAYSPEPYLHFRRGGWSHRIDTYGTLGTYLRHVWMFWSCMAQATHSRAFGWRDSCSVLLARVRFVLTFMLTPAMRRMTLAYIRRSFPIVDRLCCRYAERHLPAFRHLRTRLDSASFGMRVAVFGAGKHTMTHARTLKSIISRRHTLIAVLDDHAGQVPTIEQVPVVSSDRWYELDVDLVVISSDTYERQLYERVMQFAPAASMVWCLYDIELESTHASRSADSTSLKNCSISSIASSSASAA